MNPSLATLAYAGCILGLFYLNRDKSARTSRALWIPVIWYWILGSRAVSFWLGTAADRWDVSAQLDGSPIDAAIFQLLLVSALAILVRRGHRSLSVMAANWPIVWYFSFCLISVCWSDYPDVSFKRWIKATGDIVMALVVITDAQPVAALRRLFSRVGLVLLPSSTLLIKYYPYLSTTYDAWSGARSNTGVCTDKNVLGVTTYVLTLGVFWQVLRLFRESGLPNRFRQLLAQCSLLGFGIWDVFTANSATSESCLMLAAFLMLVTGLKRFRSRPRAVHTFIVGVIVVAGLIKITGADGVVFEALGRKPNLTGRVDIWPFLISMAPNPLLGAGFETFWLGPRLQRVWNQFPNLYVNEAHNGYLELYLELGLIGVGLVVLILIHGYRSSVAAFRTDPERGSLTLACVVSATLYSYTEAGFRNLDYSWSFLILSIFAVTSISTTYRQNTRPVTRDPQHGLFSGQVYSNDAAFR
jgi:exopolysaccharide production protein ExoQ